MWGRIIITLVIIMLVAPGVNAAQNHGGGQDQHKTKSSMSMMQGNMGMLADITAKIHQILSKEEITRGEHKQILDMIAQMSRIMKEMSVPHDEPVKRRHQQELQVMHRNIDTIHRQVFH